MNNRHIQTFLTVSAAFFAMNAPLHANASVTTPANPMPRTAQHVLTPIAGACAQNMKRSERDA
jgi:biotin transporter BioY